MRSLYATPRRRSAPPPLTPSSPPPHPFPSNSDTYPLRLAPQSTRFHPRDRSLMGAARRDYVAELEEELKKIQAFQRELPLSLDLVTRTIESFRREMAEVYGERPVVMEEFIPMKAISGPEEAEKDDRSVEGEEAQDKADWLRSAQLWNQQQQQLEQSDDVIEVGAPAAAEAEGSDAASDEGRGAAGGAQESEEQSTPKKERRCWSKDLHRKFLDALQVLGGPEVATPKQIKELMSVDGLTNDEIKSHLQKHRIRSKRPAARASLAVEDTVRHQTNQPQVLFGIWVPQGDYTTMAAAAAAAIASLPLEPKKKKQRKEKQAIGTVNATGPVARSQNATSTTGSNAPSS